MFEGDTPKSVHFGLNKSQNLGMTDSSNYSPSPIPWLHEKNFIMPNGTLREQQTLN
jgi:hypothetical protein